MVSATLLTCVLLQCFTFLSSYAHSNGFRPNYVYFSQTDSYYKIHMQRLSWFDAKQKCVSEGASLFYPEDEAEADLVLAYMKRTNRFPIYGEVHIGISDLVAKGVYETIDNRPIASVYNKWAPGEPNNKNGFNEEEDCVIIKYATGYLNDIPCGWTRCYVCKKRKSTIEWNDLCDIPDNTYEYNAKTGKCYKVHTTPMTWPQAHATCFVEQSYLAVINNAHEAEELAKLTKAATANKTDGSFMADTVLLGFHDRLKEGWTTVKGQPVEDSGYTSWGQQAGSDVPRQCGAMAFDSLLKKVECEKKALFICEHDVDDIRHND